MINNKKTSTISILMTTVLLIFLFVIQAFLWYDVLDLAVASNFMVGMCFWMINCIILVLVFPIKMYLSRKYPIGFYAPIIMVTVVYTLLLWVFMAFALLTVDKVWFVLMNLLLLFVYLLVTTPMIINGTNQ